MVNDRSRKVREKAKASDHPRRVVRQIPQWAKNVDPENVTEHIVRIAYGISEANCTGVCKKNLKNNPKCICRMGTEIWDGYIEANLPSDSDRPRTPGSPVGLTNLGATCYINSFLQLWFHNRAFRRAIFSWNPVSSTETSMQENIVEELQRLFVQMQVSPRDHLSPDSLVKLLGVNENEQQDAQEFSKLFIHNVEQALSTHQDPLVSDMIPTQFVGKQAYVTKCGSCGAESQREETFYELDLQIQQCKDLNQCLQGLLQPEELSGWNQYRCQHCNCLRNAIRYHRITKLPTVLQLSLMRFVYDQSKGTRKKLNNWLMFPEHLDMKDYAQPGEVKRWYRLIAILVHRGLTAHSGHYYAVIRCGEKGAWVQFNDEEVKVLEKKLQNAEMEEEAEYLGRQTAAKKPRVHTPKGYQSSQNCYMLVYRACGDPATDDPTQDLDEVDLDSLIPPSRLVTDADEERFVYETQLVEIMQKREELQAGLSVAKSEMEYCLKQLPVHPKEQHEYFWIPKVWLSGWLMHGNLVPQPPIDYTSLLCRHGLLDWHKLDQLRCIAPVVGTALAQRFNTEPPNFDKMQGAALLCHECVINEVKRVKFKEQLDAAQKQIIAEKASHNKTGQLYMIGKESLAQWRNVVHSTFEMQLFGESTELAPEIDQEDLRCVSPSSDTDGDDLPAVADENGNADNNNNADVDMDVESGAGPSSAVDIIVQPNGDTKSDVAAMEQKSSAAVAIGKRAFQFNYDLICEHGGLSSDPGRVVQVPESVIQILHRYLPEFPVFPVGSTLCAICENQSLMLNTEAESLRETAEKERLKLMNLYQGRCRPSLKSVNNRKEKDETVYIICKEFVNRWRSFIKSTGDRPNRICNECLLCVEHKKSMIKAELDIGGENADALVLVTEDEWTVLKQCYSSEPPTIMALRVRDSDGTVPGDVVLVPEPCDACIAARFAELEHQQYTYKNGKIYIEKRIVVTDESTSNGMKMMNGYGSDTPPSNHSNGVKNEFGANGNGLLASMGETMESFGLRRSARNPRGRNSIKITADSTMSIQNLKVRLISEANAAPIDQNLFFNGLLLDDREKTLADYLIPNGAVLQLQILKPDEKMEREIQEASSHSGPERGFAGSNLVG